MKRIAIVASMLLMLAAPAWAVDLTGMFGVGGGVGYGIGFGDNFDDTKDETTGIEASSKLQFLFGAGGRYNFDPAMGVKVFAHYQMWKIEAKRAADGVIPAIDESTTESWIGINADFVYTLMPEGNTMPYFQAGPGIYIPSAEGADMAFGGNAGVGVLHFFTPQLALDGNANFHFISKFTDAEGAKSSMALQFMVGVSYFFGGQK
jgi:hypothetical protein